jgi:DNA-binding helix-hairpin-helix protein with protein kinase domain
MIITSIPQPGFLSWVEYLDVVGETGLKATPLDPTDIPGIGNVPIGKLNLAGIHTAYDVTSEAVQAIPGLGVSKALSLVRWRETVERALRETQLWALKDKELFIVKGAVSILFFGLVISSD